MLGSSKNKNGYLPFTESQSIELSVASSMSYVVSRAWNLHFCWAARRSAEQSSVHPSFGTGALNAISSRFWIGRTEGGGVKRQLKNNTQEQKDFVFKEWMIKSHCRLSSVRFCTTQ